MNVQHVTAEAKKQYTKPELTRVEFLVEEAVFSFCKLPDGAGTRYSSGRCVLADWLTLTCNTTGS